MAMLSKEEILAIAAAARGLGVSILMPTHRARGEIRQDPIRLKNLLNEAENRLIGRGRLRRRDSDALLAPALELLDSPDFWQHRSDGLALYLAWDFMKAIDLPYQPEERLTVGSSFRIRPLLPLLDGGERFTVITVSLAGARVYAADRRGLAERRDLDLPHGIKEIMAETDYQQMTHSPTARARTATGEGALSGRHNFGETPEELRKAELIEYLHRLDAALLAPLSGRNEPVVIVGDPQVSGHFHAISKLPNLHKEAVEVNAGTLDARQLHQRVLPLVEPLFARPRQAALEQLRALQGSGDQRVTTAVPEIVKAARFARVDTVFLPESAEAWGRFDEAADQVELRGAPEAGDVELLDQAAVDTLRNGGAVLTLSRDELPLGAAAAAILRY